MTDVECALMAAACATGALVARSVPDAGRGWPALVAAFVACGLALARRHPLVLCAAAAALAAVLGARAWAGLEVPTSGRVDERVTLVSDPQDVHGATRAEVRLDGHRAEVWARGTAGRALADRLVGERVDLVGGLGPVPAAGRERLAVHHVGVRLSASRVTAAGDGGVLVRSTNGFRRLLEGGAAALPAEQRALFAGVVLGDDRDEAATVAADFDGAGLSHLLAVSGQNVAFALVLVAPLARRLPVGARLAAGLGTLVAFGALVRWEPSVLRATAMAGLVLCTRAAGVEATPVRLLSLAVAALVLVDPLLVHSTGFRLSVAATAGLALLARRIAERMPGPRRLAEAVGVTLAAQVGVAPLLLTGTAGSLPIVALPANLLAVPAAGPVTAWGLAAGPVAGLLGGRVAALVHLPTRLLLGWIAGVARVAAAVPVGRAGPLVAVVAGLLGLAAWRAPSRGRRRLCLVALVAVLLAPAIRPAPPVDDGLLATGVRLWRSSGATVVVLEQPDGRQLLAGLARARVGRVDVVVATDVASAGPGLQALVGRHPVGVVLGPRSVTRPGISSPGVGEGVVVGGLTVEVAAATEDALQVRVGSSTHAARPRSAPP